MDIFQLSFLDMESSLSENACNFCLKLVLSLWSFVQTENVNKLEERLFAMSVKYAETEEVHPQMSILHIRNDNEKVFRTSHFVDFFRYMKLYFSAKQSC